MSRMDVLANKADILTPLDVCVDFIVQLGGVMPEFGQKENLVGDYDVELGGSCGIFASQAAKLGLQVQGVGVVGEDYFGRFYRDRLQDCGIRTDYIRTDRLVKTGMGVALCKPGDRAILTYMGTIDAVDGPDITEEMLKNARHLHIGSFYLMKRLNPYIPALVKKAKALGLTVSLDTNWDPEEKWDSGLWEVLPHVDIFLPNENEVKYMAKTGSVEEAIRLFAGKVPCLAVKMGPKGAMAVAGGKEFRAEPVDVPVVDTVGAGDSFDAGFVYGFLRGYSIEESLRIGCICGSYNTTCAGGVAGQLRETGLRNVLEGLGIWRPV